MAAAYKKQARVVFNAENTDVPSQKLFEATDLVQELSTRWLRTLDTEGARIARGYLRKGRALTSEFILEEGIGYVPFDPRFTTRTLVEHFVRSGGDPHILACTGCCAPNSTFVRSEFTRLYPSIGEKASSEELTDFFFSKLLYEPKAYMDYPPFEVEPEGSGKFLRGEYLMLPLRVRDPEGKLAIGSWIRRSLRENTKRYMSPKNTRIFSSRDTILGLAGNEDRLEKDRRAVIQEGLFDKYSVMSSYANMGNSPVVLAMGGTGSSPEANPSSHRFPEKYKVFEGKTVTLFLDNDRGGFNAAIGNALQFISAGAHVNFASLRDACEFVGNFDLKDTNDLLKYAKKTGIMDKGYEGIRHAVEVAERRHVVDFISEQVEYQKKVSPKGILFTFDVLAYLLPIVETLPDSQRSNALFVSSRALGMSHMDMNLHFEAYLEQKSQKIHFKPVQQMGSDKPRRMI